LVEGVAAIAVRGRPCTRGKEEGEIGQSILTRDENTAG